MGEGAIALCFTIALSRPRLETVSVNDGNGVGAAVINNDEVKDDADDDEETEDDSTFTHRALLLLPDFAPLKSSGVLGATWPACRRGDTAGEARAGEASACCRGGRGDGPEARGANGPPDASPGWGAVENRF